MYIDASKNSMSSLNSIRTHLMADEFAGAYPQKVLLCLQDHSRKPNWFVSPLADQLHFVGVNPMKNDRVLVTIPHSWSMMWSSPPKESNSLP